MFKLTLLNSKTHSVEHATEAIKQANGNIGHDEAQALAGAVHARGRAIVVKGTRAVCRRGAKAIREMGGDSMVPQHLKSQAGWDKLDWVTPMRTKIEKTKG